MSYAAGVPTPRHETEPWDDAPDSLDFVASWPPEEEEQAPPDGDGALDPPWDAPWCVDLGEHIECMTKVQIWMGLATGRLTPGIRVWREGRPWWLPIAAVDELTGIAAAEELVERELADEAEEPAAGAMPARASERHPSHADDQELVRSSEPSAAPVPLRVVKLGLRPHRTWMRRALLLVSGCAVGVALAVAGNAAGDEPPAPRFQPVSAVVSVQR